MSAHEINRRLDALFRIFQAKGLYPDIGKLIGTKAKEELMYEYLPPEKAFDLAACRGRVDIMKQTAEGKVKFVSGLEDGYGDIERPMMCALENGHIRVIDYLLTPGSPFYKKHVKMISSYILQAIESGHTKGLNHLLTLPISESSLTDTNFKHYQVAAILLESAKQDNKHAFLTALEWFKHAIERKIFNPTDLDLVKKSKSTHKPPYQDLLLS